MDVKKRNWIPGAAVAAAAVLACAGAVWGNHVARTGSVAVGVPDAGPEVKAACAALHAKLPTVLEGRRQRGSVPHSTQTAVWGSPTTVLRCGVEQPAAITVGGDDYTPLQNQIANIDGVNWLIERQRPDSVKFATTDRSAYIEVYVPGDTAHATDVLVDLAPLIIQSVPAKDGGLVPDASGPASS